MKIGNKKIIFLAFLIIISIVPVLTHAQIIPNCGDNQECGFDDLMKLFNNIVDWIIRIAVPISAGVFAWAGIKYMTTGVSDKKSEAKEMIRKVFIGLVCILAAWIIVSTITDALLSPTFEGVVDFQ